jgi:hypothetical protein
VKLAQNLEFHRRTKHIAIKYFFIREKLPERKVGIQQVSTHDQVADIKTKPLARTRPQILCNQMGLLQTQFLLDTYIFYLTRESVKR